MGVSAADSLQELSLSGVTPCPESPPFTLPVCSTKTRNAAEMCAKSSKIGSALVVIADVVVYNDGKARRPVIGSGVGSCIDKGGLQLSAKNQRALH